MYIYLSKILPLLVMPIGLVFMLSMIALVLLWKRKNRSSMVFLVMAMLVLWVSSMPIVAHDLLGRLERQYPPVLMRSIPVSDCAVLLGGAVQPIMKPRVDVELNESADRVYKAASLYRSGKTRRIIIAGGNQPWSEFEQTEAQAMQMLLESWGVPATAILLEGASRNTHENALNAWEILQKTGCIKPLLITSASHMKRSVDTFAKIGIEVFPVSTDIRVVQTTRRTIFDFLPDAEALKMTTAAMREWVGQKVYQWRGWN